jgi:hypothetical protein
VSLGQDTVVSCGDIQDSAAIGVFITTFGFSTCNIRFFFFLCLCLAHIGVIEWKKCGFIAKRSYSCYMSAMSFEISVSAQSCGLAFRARQDPVTRYAVCNPYLGGPSSRSQLSWLCHNDTLWRLCPVSRHTHTHEVWHVNIRNDVSLKACDNCVAYWARFCNRLWVAGKDSTRMGALERESLFVVYLTTLSLVQVMQCRMVEVSANDELVRMWKKRQWLGLRY